MAIDLHTFLVKSKTRMVIEEYRCNIYDKHVEIETMWARLADSVVLVCVMLNTHILSHVV